MTERDITSSRSVARWCQCVEAHVALGTVITDPIPLAQPRAHGLDLADLRDDNLLAHRNQVRVVGAIQAATGAHDGRPVMADHRLHERNLELLRRHVVHAVHPLHGAVGHFGGVADAVPLLQPALHRRDLLLLRIADLRAHLQQFRVHRLLEAHHRHMDRHAWWSIMSVMKRISYCAWACVGAGSFAVAGTLAVSISVRAAPQMPAWWRRLTNRRRGTAPLPPCTNEA